MENKMLEKWRNKIINIDCRDGLMQLPNDSINCVITSPPYWSLRDYNIPPSIWDGDSECEHDFQINTRKIEQWGHGPNRVGNNSNPRSEGIHEIKEIKEGFCSKCGAWKGCLGLEPNFELFIKHLCDIYDQVKRVLRKDGTCWVNLGDSYASGIKGSGGKKSKKVQIKGKENFQSFKPIKVDCSVPDKCLCMIPQRFVIEMVNRGWILRNVIIWYKPNCMPSSVRDRFTVDFEYIYFFVKSKKYWFEQQREPHLEESKRRAMRGNNMNKYSKGSHFPKGVHANTMSQPRKYKGYDNMEDEIKQGNTPLHSQGRNKRCVWKIPTKPNPEAHFATFPPNLAKPMIKSGCPEYVCKKCGKAREKIVERKKWKPTRKHEGKHYKDMLKVSESSAFNHREDWEKFKKENPDKFKGYTDCGCNAGFKPGIVLDIFAGTGTTCKTAFNLGRDYIGFEISKDYVDNIAKKTLNSTKNMRLTDFLKLPQTKKLIKILNENDKNAGSS